jgi:hypothetical protein
VSCSQCAGIQDQFDDSAVRKKLRHYRRRGPDRTTRLLIDILRDALETSDVRDGVLMDVGGGIGAIHHALLDGRVSRAVHIDASTAQIAAARDETTLAWMRVAIAALNLFQRLRGSAFRVFLHDPDAIDRVLRSAGLVPRAERHTLGWLVVVYARPAGAHR